VRYLRAVQASERDTPRYFSAGDPVRGLAALTVVLFHAGYFVAGHYSRGPDFGAVYGTVGQKLLTVALLSPYVFFTLSAYLLTRPFIAAFTHGTRTPSLSRFLRGRLFRIGPAWWLIVAYGLLRFGAYGTGPGGILAVFGFFQTSHESVFAAVFPHAWTIDVEALFYVLIPIAAILLTPTLGRAARGRARFAIVSGLFALCFVVFYIRHQDATGFGAWGDPANMLPAFIGGIGLAATEVLYRDRLRGWAHGRALAAGLGVAALIALTINVWVPAPIEAVTGARFLLAIATGTLFVAAPLVLEWTRGECWRWLDRRPLHWIGERSYSLYLVNQLVALELARHLLGHGVARDWFLETAATLAISLALAAVMFRYVEEPFRRVGKGRRRPKAPEPTTAPATLDPAPDSAPAPRASSAAG
jgi:peptidoglycan/LPS O-acetylase OafA/YrhL